VFLKIKKEVEEVVKTYETYTKIKAARYKPYELLEPLLII